MEVVKIGFVLTMATIVVAIIGYDIYGTYTTREDIVFNVYIFAVSILALWGLQILCWASVLTGDIDETLFFFMFAISASEALPFAWLEHDWFQIPVTGIMCVIILGISDIASGDVHERRISK